MRCEEADIPARMKHLDRDKRGLPIPFIVFRDLNGDPHFTINDTAVVQTVISDKRCSICGDRLGNNIWMIGGPQSAFHQHGAYIDPALHKDCGRFALKTCPYIALPSWSDQKRIDARTLKPGTTPDHLLLQDRTMIPDRPALFVFGKTSGYFLTPAPPNGLVEQYYVVPRRPWIEVEFWRNGQQITKQEAVALLMDAGFKPETWKFWR